MGLHPCSCAELSAHVGDPGQAWQPERVRRGLGLLGCRGEGPVSWNFSLYKTLWYNDVFQSQSMLGRKEEEDHYSNLADEEIEAKGLMEGSGLPKDP